MSREPYTSSGISLSLARGTGSGTDLTRAGANLRRSGLRYATSARTPSTVLGQRSSRPLSTLRSCASFLPSFPPSPSTDGRAVFVARGRHVIAPVSRLYRDGSRDRRAVGLPLETKPTSRHASEKESARCVRINRPCSARKTVESCGRPDGRVFKWKGSERGREREKELFAEKLNNSNIQNAI